MTCHRNAWNNASLLIKKDSAMRLARCPFPVINCRSAAIRFSDQHKTAAADVSGAGPSNGQRQTDGDRGVNGITPSLQNFYADFRGELIRRSHHAMSSTDGRICQRLAKRRFRKGQRELTEKYETSEGESHYGPMIHFLLPHQVLQHETYTIKTKQSNMNSAHASSIYRCILLASPSQLFPHTCQGARYITIE